MNIFKMLPFLKREDVDKLLEKASNEELSQIPLSSILPFASTKTIDRMVLEEFKKTGNFKSSYSPFISAKCLHEIVVYHIENDFGELPDSVLPFLNSEDVKLLFDYSISKGDFDKSVLKYKKRRDDYEDEDEDDDDEDEDEDDEDEDD